MTEGLDIDGAGLGISGATAWSGAGSRSRPKRLRKIKRHEYIAIMSKVDDI
jgi:hypothetical protein